jgi:hypothetical protein
MHLHADVRISEQSMGEKVIASDGIMPQAREHRVLLASANKDDT